MRRYGSWFGASLGAVIAYTSAVLTQHLPALSYFPRLGLWGMHPIPGEPMISWYGWLGWGVLGALVGAGATARLMGGNRIWHAIWVIGGAAILLLFWHERAWFRR